MEWDSGRRANKKKCGRTQPDQTRIHNLGEYPAISSEELMKEYILGIISFVFAISLLLLSGEIAIRVYYHLRYTKNQSTGKSIVLDKQLGWLPTSNYRFDGQKIDANGKSYSVVIQTNNEGFRVFGNPQESDKRKVLFLGDSFTHAMQVSDNKTYYGILKNALSIEVFAFGGGGYGTLQEYMILDKYLDEIRPDIVVVQFSSNDFINNSYELEIRSSMHNNAMRRPYLAKDGIVYRLPKRFATIRAFVNKYSRFIYFMISRIDRLRARHTHSVEDTIKEEGMSYPFFRESVGITEQLIHRIRLRIPSATEIYAFSVDDSSPFYDEFKRISRMNEIRFIDGIPQSIRSAEQRGITTRAADKAHWNETGHQIAAGVLEHYFEAHW